jgi:hypothetical protein
MRGIIGTREVLRHPWLIISGFGTRCYLRCLGSVLRGRRATFLEIAFSE